MGRLYIEFWSQHIDETGMLSCKEKIKLFLSRLSVSARFLLITGLLLLLIGMLLNNCPIMTIGLLLLVVFSLILAVDFKRSGANDSLSNINFVSDRAQVMAPQFLEHLQIGHTELPMVLKLIKEYHATQITKEKTTTERLFNFFICSLLASCLVLALEFFKNGSFEWSSLMLAICILIPFSAFFILVIRWVVDSLRFTAIDKTRLIIRYLECYLIHESCINTELQNRSVSE